MECVSALHHNKRKTNYHISDPEQQLKVFDKKACICQQRKSASTIQERKKSKPTMRQGRNGTEFKGKERKALTEQIKQTEQEISERLDKLPDTLKEDGYL